MPPKQAGYLIHMEDRIGAPHLVVSNDVTFDENFESSTVTDTAPLPGAQPTRPSGSRTSLSYVDPDAELHYTGSVEDVLHPVYSAREEENETLPMGDDRPMHRHSAPTKL